MKLVKQTSRFISSSSNTPDDSVLCTDRTQAISTGAGNKCPKFSFLLVFIFNERPTSSTLMHCDQITNPNQTRLSLNLTSCHSWATFPIMTPILQRLWHSVWDGIWGSCQHGYQAVERPRPCYSSDFTSITLSAHFLSSGAAILTVTIKPLSKNYPPSLPPRTSHLLFLSLDHQPFFQLLPLPLTLDSF